MENINLLSENFNPMPTIKVAYDEDFLKDKRIIGCSSVGMGSNKIVLEKCYGIDKPTTMTMLSGKWMHSLIQDKKVRIPLVNYINEQCGYTVRNIGDHPYILLDNGNYFQLENLDEYEYTKKYPEKIYTQIGKDRFLRQHPDIYVGNLYIIEIKYTGLHYKEFIKDEYLNRIFHYRIQLNLYMGLNGLKRGFLFIVNKGIFSTTSKNWDFVNNNYIHFIEVLFSQKLFDASLKITHNLFDRIEKEEFNTLPCPNMLWECDPKYCQVRADCKNPITKLPKGKLEDNQVCAFCGEIIEMGFPCLLRDKLYYHYRDKMMDGEIMGECVQNCKDAWEVRESE